MDALLAYALKANLLLALGAAGYYGLLRQQPALTLGRAYLLAVLALAVAGPLLPMPALLPGQAAQWPLATLTAGTAAAPVHAAAGLDWWRIGVAGYGAGAAALLLRLLGQLASLAALRRRARPATVLGQVVWVLPGAGGPFSFGRGIYFFESTLTDAPATAAMLRHEQAHVQQGHTLDVLLWQLATALAWLNPAAWLLRRAALANLEYLADRAALRGSGLPVRQYQLLLLRQQATASNSPALAFQFAALALRRRVLLLGQPAASGQAWGRYALAAALLLALALGVAGARRPVLAARLALPPGLRYYLDGRPVSAATAQALDPTTLASVQVLSDPVALWELGQDRTGLLVLTTKTHAQAPAVLALDAQLGLAAAYRSQPALLAAPVPREQAYLARRYPAARPTGPVQELTAPGTHQVRYRVPLQVGQQQLSVDFDARGNALAP